MSPHEHETRRRTATSDPLAASWDRYLDSRGPRAHGDLLRAVDGHIRTEARRLLGPRHPLVEEVAQEALVGAARRISSGERPDFPMAYVRKIVHNKVVDMVRREAARRDRELQQWTPEVAAGDASMSAEWHDFLDTLRTLVSDDEFWTLVLRYHFDYSYGEIGDLLDKEPNAIRQIAHRGRRKCRDHLTRLEGRVPAWVLLPDAGPESGGRVAETADGDQPGLREPRTPDSAERSRRLPAESDSGPEARPPIDAPAVPANRWRRRPRLRPDGPGRPFGSPTTVVPLALLVALPVLFQVDRALDATTVDGSVVRTAAIVERGPDGGGTQPPSGPTISVTTSTAPTDPSEAPSTSAPPAPTSSAPPTSDTTIDGAPPTTAETSSTASAPPQTTSTTTSPPTTRPSSTTTARPTTVASTAPPSTTSTARPTSTASTTTTTTGSTTTAPSSSATSSTVASSTTTTTMATTTTTGRSTTSGRDPGGDQ